MIRDERNKEIVDLYMLITEMAWNTSRILFATTFTPKSCQNGCPVHILNQNYQ